MKDNVKIAVTAFAFMAFAADFGTKTALIFRSPTSQSYEAERPANSNQPYRQPQARQTPTTQASPINPYSNQPRTDTNGPQPAPQNFAYGDTQNIPYHEYVS